MMLPGLILASFVAIPLEILGSNDAGHTASFEIRWKQPSEGASISCTRETGKYVHVVTASGSYKRLLKSYNETYELTKSELFSLEFVCNCAEQCAIPQLKESRRWKWTLVITYECLDIWYICENNKTNIMCVTTPGTKLDITYANYGRTSEAICQHPSYTTNYTDCRALKKTLEIVQTYCQDEVTCELNADNAVFNDTCRGTYKYLEVHFACKTSDKPSTTARGSTSIAGTTSSTVAQSTTVMATTTKTLLRTTVVRRTSSRKTTADSSREPNLTVIIPSSTSRHSFTTLIGSSPTEISTNPSITYDNSPTTDETRTAKGNLGFKSDSSKSTTVAIAVSITLIVVAVSVATSILVFRRWRRKTVDDTVYKNGTAVENRNDGDGFTNMTYFKVAENVVLQDSQQQHIDANSNSGDSGYTDMHNEEAENNDYYMIKENMRVDSAEIVDDQYYAIKDNVSSEYNKIAFKPKVIPDDSNYGHTLRPGKENVTDETYDHAESGGTLLHAQSHEDINEYSHLNERKPKIVYETKPKVNVDKGRGIPMAKQIGDDGLTGHTYFVLEQDGNELPADSTDVAGQDYFVLEKGQSQQIDQGATTVTDTECHDYFVLSKEELADDSNGNNSKPKDFVTCLKHDTHNETQNDVNDHTYFENPLSTELADDIHQYQGMDHRSSNIEPENKNHDYFILEKKNA